MGITGFAKFVEETFPGKVIEEIQLRDLDIPGRIAVDGSNEAYVQMHVARTEIIGGLSPERIFEICRGGVEQRRAMYDEIRKRWVTRVLDFIMTDLKNRVVWVIDGEHVPKLKEETRRSRREKTDRARETFHAKMEELAREEFPNPSLYRKALSEYVTSKPPTFEDYQTLYSVLVSLNIPLVKAWGEGEKTCALLCIPGKNPLPDHGCEAVWSADTDSILFGAPILIQRRASGYGKEFGKIPGKLRIYRAANFPLPRESIVRVCIAHGCDYLPRGIPGLGLKRAFKIYGSDSPPELPPEIQPVERLFEHDLPTETPEVFQKPPRDCPIVRWFRTIYG